MSRPEHVKCIADTHIDNKGKSWCGRNISMQFYFASIDHAAMNGRGGARLVACKGCTDAVMRGLSNGQEAPCEPES